MTWTAYYDRRDKTIEGLFTLKSSNPADEADNLIRLPARSGQRGYEGTSWERGKSPIPVGKYWLWVGRGKDIGVQPGRTGIGEFYPISSGDDPRLIINVGRPMPKKNRLFRQDIGLHPENALPGSAGCIVILKDWDRLAERLRLLGKTQERIPLVVL